MFLLTLRMLDDCEMSLLITSLVAGLKKARLVGRTLGSV